ncbi:MAG: hypothetical protein ABEN55_18450, partial [Bradymonadaceae bacterium]
MRIEPIVVACSLFALTVFAATPVVAQDESGVSSAAKKGAATVILKFETMEVSQEIMDAFY